jgi:hypothetical protein
MTNKYEQFGKASLIPGLVYSIEILQDTIDLLRKELYDKSVEKMAHMLKKPKESHKGLRKKSGWSNNPEERKKEMARRYKVALANKANREKGAA